LFLSALALDDAAVLAAFFVVGDAHEQQVVLVGDKRVRIATLVYLSQGAVGVFVPRQFNKHGRSFGVVRSGDKGEIGKAFA
jgi:hypothetical protein